MDKIKNRDLNNDISSCLQSLESIKITERKLKRQEIGKLLENDEVIEMLNYNSVQQIKSSTSIENNNYIATWKNLLYCCHKSLILDVEKEVKKHEARSINYKSPNIESCSILLKNIINKANKDKPYLPCHDFLKCVLDVSRNDIYEKFVGELYYKILEQNILSQKYYWHFLNEHWNNLFNLTCKLYTANFANMKHVSIKLMKHIVIGGDAHSSLTLIIKTKIFPYLKQAIIDALQVNNNISFREELLILSLVVCKTVGVECRISLCRFIEENCIHLINFYKSDRLKKVQEALYQLLTIFIKVHHPKCIDLNHKVSYVHNKQLWISHLYQIYEFVCHEIQQSRNNANPNFSNFISELAITIFKTVHFNKLESLNTTLDKCSPKRRKLDINLLSFLIDFTDLKISEICTRLNIITKLLENHSLPFDERDYFSLVQCITKCFDTFKNSDLTKHLITCCTILFERENIIELLMSKVDQVVSFFKSIWTFILKVIISNENPDISHKLLQSLIALKNWCDEMYADVLRPYINKTLKLNNQSLKTLIVLFETRGFSSIILSKANIFSLFDWLLIVTTHDESSTVFPYSKVDPYLLSQVVGLILTKPGVKKLFMNNNSKIKSSHDFTDIYFYVALQDIPKIHSVVAKPIEKKHLRLTFDSQVFEKLTNFITQTMAIEEKLNIQGLQFLFFLTNFLCFLESQFFQFSNKINEFELYKFKYLEKVKNILFKHKDNINKLNDKDFVDVCSLFYKNMQLVDDKIINKVLNHEANKCIAIKLYNFCKLNDSSNMFQVFDYNSLTDEQKLSIEGVQVLLNTCLYNGQILNGQTSFLDILLQDCEKLEDSISHSYNYFKLVGFLHKVLKLNDLPIDIIIKINKFIKLLAKNWCFHKDGFIQIIQLLHDELAIVNKNSSNVVCTSNLLMMIWSLQTISNSKKSGPLMVCAFVDLLGHFASVENGSFGVFWSINTNMVKPMSPENIIQYINSPFLQVRISVIKYIKRMCDAYEINPNAYVISYEKMFNIILHNIHEGFKVDTNICEEECEDEYTNRISTYFLCMQALLISSAKYRKQCLFEIFQTVHDKKMNFDLVVNLLEGTVKELKIETFKKLLEDNLTFLLWNWHFKYLDFKEFPIKLFSCAQMKQFVDKYSNKIIPILITKNDMDLLNSMDGLPKKVEDNFADIYSLLLAMKTENVYKTIINQDKIKDLINKTLGEQDFDELIKSQFPDILLNCIQMVVSDSEQPIAPIQINSNQFLQISTIFQELCIRSKIPLLVVMCKKQPNHIQLIIHILYVNIFKKSTSELRCQSFFQYTFFMKILINQLLEFRDLDDFSHFLVHQSIQSTITIINQNYIEIQNYALKYIEWLLSKQSCIKFNINQIQSQITSAFKILTKNKLFINHTITQNILNILKKMSDQNINYKINDESMRSLQEEINIFLSHQNVNSNVIQSLQCLKKKLKTNEEELQSMYKELLTMRGFSEDCVKSVLHRFISTLIHFTNSDDSEIKILAASCLGILGPADLATLILQPESEILPLESNNSSEYCFIKHIVLMLLNYLSDDNILVMEASNKTLFKALATQEGPRIYEEIGRCIIYPFIYSQMDEEDIRLSFNMEQFNLIIDVKEIWCPSDPLISYNNWITIITAKLFETLEGFCTSLLPVAENKPIFCEQILPHLIYFILENQASTRSILNKYLNCFFLKHYEKIKILSDNSLQVSNDNESNIYCNRSAVQCLLNIVHFIRLQQKSPLQNLLDINYLYVSQAAQFCSAHFTSILYLELWCELEFKTMKKDHWSKTFNPIDVITEILPEDGLLLQSILNEAYKNIGDSDAIEGCGSSYLLTLSSRTRYYQLLRKWDRVMENCDLQQRTENITNDYLEAFSNSGLQNIAQILASNNDNIKYDYCWQLSKWDLPDNGDTFFEALHYHALRYVHQKNQDIAISVINEARLSVMESLSCASLESTATVYAPLAKLKIIEDLEDFISTSDKDVLFENWLNINTLRTNDFVNINKILAQRSILLDFCGDNRSGILRLKAAEIAQKNDWLQETGRNLASVVSLQNYQEHTSLWAKVEESRLLWQRNDCHMARVLLKYVVEELENHEYPFLQSLALQLYGSWMEETKSETASDIIQKYFQKAIRILSFESSSEKECGLECRKVLSDAHKHLSQFTDTLYQQISKYVKTEDLKKRLHGVENDKEKANALLVSANENEKRAGFFLLNQSNIDESDIYNINFEKIRYLKIALQNYFQLMALDDENELPIYRVISLWLENKDNDDINMIVDQELKKKSSHKFIMVLPQLVAHLSLTYDHEFHKSLESFINRCANEHPYQTIPIVYAVANANKDKTYTGRKQPIDNEEDRVSAAKHLMSIWKKNKKINSIVINIEKLYEAFIHLAYKNISCSSGQKAEIPNDEPLMKINKSDLYVYPAMTLPLNKHGQYSNIISIHRFESSFMNAGGLHQPKKLDCVCSDGVIRSILLKGNEDMRQDAVMQQVFVLMNRLLQTNKSTFKRKLTIRTYKVIPFSQQSGIAEWCVNTMSLSDYLVGKNSNPGAHEKYRPDDMVPSHARLLIKTSKENNDNKSMRLNKYLKVCEKLKPVFRYYFFEKFLSPSIWFERRQAYIHSVATTSMVGYILGLGDRHVHNILIDNNTAELIHIDFGVAFEQGTLLNTPETVPFRLSRDIEDGMGICGIEGTFRKCCEKTMSVLRENQDVIVTVIEVLLYDPCYEWTLTEEKAAQLQNQSKLTNDCSNSLFEVNKLAERSLNKIRVKLCGMEEAGNAASINGQVNRIIQQARDPSNLALLFHGWQAFL